MNECPLPSPFLVLRDAYKSRSPGQPAEFHEAPRCKSEGPTYREREREREIVPHSSCFKGQFGTKADAICQKVDGIREAKLLFKF